MLGIEIPIGGLILLLIRTAMYIVGGYCLFLLIKLIHRAIEALDIYIANNDRLNNKHIKQNVHENREERNGN